MGVYINMKMPKSCTVCPFENFGDCYGGKVKAIMDIDDYVSAGKRHPRCPLVPVPPHGRLVDADRLLSEQMKRKYYHLPNGDTAIPIIDVEHAPTVIEEEEGER